MTTPTACLGIVNIAPDGARGLWLCYDSLTMNHKSDAHIRERLAHMMRPSPTIIGKEVTPMATPRKKTAQPVATQEAPKVVRPNELAKELGADPKRVRAFLRQEFTRSAEAKNTNWELTPEMVTAITERFAPSDDES